MCADRYLNSADGNDADDGSTRALADATLTAAIAAQSAGDRCFIDDGHSENLGANTTYTFGGTLGNLAQLICVDFAGTADPNPPVSADLRGPAATWGTSGNFSLTLGGFAYIRGTKFVPGTGAATTAHLNLLTSGAGALLFDTCEIGLLSTNGAPAMFLGASGSSIQDQLLLWRNTQIRLSATGQDINVRACRLYWLGGGLLGTAPTILFSVGTDVGAHVVVAGVDLSTVTGTLVDVAPSTGGPVTFDFVNCKLASGVAVITGTFTGPGGVEVRLWNCDSGDTNYRNEMYSSQGTLVTDTAVVHSGGASNGTTAFSWKMTTTSVASSFVPADSFPIAGWVSSTGSTTFTITYIHGESVALKDDEIWLEVEYLGTSGFPLGLLGSDSKADVLATAANHTADSTQAWDTGVTARANSTAYSLGDIRRAATPNGRLFIVTTAGTSGGSEPAAFATAADGDSVTENTVTWRCMRREKLSVTVTVNEIGPFRAWVHVGKPSLSSLYVDPKVIVS